MSDEFFRTMMGRKFYESDVPRVAKALERIADALEKQGGADKVALDAIVEALDLQDQLTPFSTIEDVAAHVRASGRKVKDR